MTVGCVKEIKKHERRVGVTPDNARAYSDSGHVVLMQTGAGAGAGFSDEDYIASGARIVDSAAKVWSEADMIVKVKEPLEQEYEHMHEGQIVYTYLHLAADEKLTYELLKRKVKGVAYETIMDSNGNLPLLKPMSEIAGRLSAQEGAKYLQSHYGGEGLLLSGVPGVAKGRVLVLGAGIVGLNAAKISLGLGAAVTLMDINVNKLSAAEDLLGHGIQTVYSSPAELERLLPQADVVIGSVLIPGASAPKLIRRKHLSMMKKGAVIVDVAVDQGGCCETTKVTYHDDPVFIVDGVVHYCVANMPGAVAITSTKALTNVTIQIGLCIANNGLEKAAHVMPDIYGGINTYNGLCTQKNVSEHFNLEYTDIHTII